MGDENPIRTLGDYSKPSHDGYRNTIELPEGNNVVQLLTPSGLQNSKMTSLCFNNIKESLFLKHGLVSKTYYKKSLIMASIFSSKSKSFLAIESRHKMKHRSISRWDFAKLVKAISLPQDVPSTSDRRLIELKNQVQRLMKAHLAAKQHVQVNKITSSCEIYSGPHDTQFFIKNLEPTFVEYVSSHTNKVGGKWYTFKHVQNNLGDTYNPSWKSHPNLSKMTNKIDIVSKAITDRITGALLSDAVKNPKLNVKYTSLVLSTRSYPTRDPQCSSHSPNSVNVSKTCFKETNHSQKDRLQMVTEIRTRQTKEPQQTLKDEFKDLHLNFPVLEVIAHAPMYNAILDKYVENLELRKNGSAFIQDGTKSYPVGIVRDVEVYIERQKLLNDFYIIDMKKDLETPLLVGRGFIATAIAVIDCRKAKIAIGEEINRSVFRVKGIKLGEEEAPYWTKLGKKESYRPQPSSDGVGAQTPYYARKEFMDCHLPKE
nr:hypothetical protein [Tanacetum cinerariifolium]